MCGEALCPAKDTLRPLDPGAGRVVMTGATTDAFEENIVSNPLVAVRQDSTTAISGLPLLESASDTAQAIAGGNWAAGVLGVAGVGLEALGMVMDPFGAIFAAGVGWLIEHVGPLSDALDALTGDPDQIQAHAQTWANIAQELAGVSADLVSAVEADTLAWTGASADSYRGRATDTANLIAAAQAAADGAAGGIGTAGEVVAAVRMLVRDIIAELVGHLISWALEVLATVGFAMVWVVPQVVTAVASTAGKIARLTSNLVQAMGKLGKLLAKLGGNFGDVSKALKNVRPGTASTVSSHPGPSSRGTSGPPDGNGSATHTSSSDSAGFSTTPSSAPKGDPAPRPDPVADPPPASRGSIDGGGGTTPSGSTPRHDPRAGNKPDNPRDRGVPADSRVCASDPVDIASGEVVQVQHDLTFEGPLELVLTRTHVSSYRAGRWFGPSWASTLDQRLEVGGTEVCYFSPDAMILVYPKAEPGVAVLPMEGPRWPLSQSGDGTYVLENGHTLRFGEVPGLGRDIRPLLTLSDTEGREVAMDYDRSGAPRAVRHSDGYLARFETADDRVTAIDVVDTRDGGTVRAAAFRYDERGHLAQVVNSSGQPLLFDYDADGRMAGWQDRNGTWYRYVYDADGRCRQTVGDKGFMDGKFVYDRVNRVTRHTDSLGNTTVYELNEAGQVMYSTDPLGNVTGFEWDRYDRMLSRTDPLGHRTGYAYDDAGRLSEVTRPDGVVIRILQENNGPFTIMTEAAGHVWYREYADPKVPDPFTEQLGVFVDDYSEALGGHAPEVVDRDLFGRPRSAAGGTVGLKWTVEGLPAARTRRGAPTDRWRYDPEGNEIGHTNALGHLTTSEYGTFDTRTATVDVRGGRTSYEYDTELRLVAVVDPRGLRWTYRFDAAGRLVAETDFDGRQRTFGYDAAGRLVLSVNSAGTAVAYTHDVLGNLVELRTGRSVVRYTYDPLGRLTSAVSEDAVLELDRDAHGRVLAETSNGRRTTYDYGPDGSVRRRTPSGVDSEWTYDEAGRPSALISDGHVLRFGYDPAGREAGVSLDESVVLDRTYDQDGELAGQRVTALTGVALERAYTYRADGHLVSVADKIRGTTRYSLDASGRVLELASPHRLETYRYDVAGTLTFAGLGQHDATAGERRYAGTTVVSAGSVTYAHDGHGRAVARGGTRLHWDADDHLVGVDTADGARWRYLYDPIGRRIAKERLDHTERVDFTWNGGVIIEQVHTDALGRQHTTTWHHHPVGDRPVTQSSTEGFFLLVTDPVGTPTELVDAQGAVAWHSSTTLWGKEDPRPAGSATTPLRFPGQYADSETGLHYNVFRYYDPALGRYLSQDPLGLAPAPDPAGYVHNPLRAWDPLGLSGVGCSSSKGGGGKKTPGSGKKAAQVADTAPSSSRIEGHGTLEQVPLGKKDGSEVELEAHQNKHQASPVLGLRPVPIPRGATRFPSHVGAQWHQVYFADEAAKHARKHLDDEVIPKLEQLRHAATRVPDDQKAIADLRVKNAEGMWPRNEQHIAQMKQERDALLEQEKKALAAEREYLKYLDQVKKGVSGPLKTTDFDDGVEYDITHRYDPDTGAHSVSYHCNPRDNNWWDDHGKRIVRDNPRKNLPGRN